MNDNLIMESIVKILSENVDKTLDSNYQLSDHLRDHGIDSIALMALTVYIENTFNITMDDIYYIEHDELTFQNLIDLVNKQIHNKNREQ